MSRGIVPAVSRGQQVAQGVLSGSTLLLVTVGVPVVLVLVGGSPVPHGLVHAVRVDMSLRQLFDKPIADTWIVHAAFALAWCAWLWLSVCVVVEMVSWVSGRTPVRVPGSRTMQAVAAFLVGTTLAVMSADRILGPSVHPTARVSLAASASPAPPRTTSRSLGFGPAPGKTPRGVGVVDPGATSTDAYHRATTKTTPILSRSSTPTGAPRSGSALSEGRKIDLPSEQASGVVKGSAAWPVSETSEESAELSDLVETVAAPPVRTYVVQPRDTLWSIAASQLGSPLLWPEIAQANYGRPQPDGGVLTDAHWIDPGWVLVLPADASVADAVTPSTSAPATPVTAVPASSAPMPHPATSPHPAATSSSTAAVQADPVRAPQSVHRTDGTPKGQTEERHGGFPVTPIGAGLLGAGLVAIIDRMRRAQQRHRRAGEHIRLPHPALSSLERRLRISDDPSAPYAVDAALRTFASGPSSTGVPVVAGVRVHP